MPSAELAGRVALVTGGSQGIGRAVCLALAAAGAAVAVHYNSSRAAAQDVVEAIRRTGGRSEALQADLASSQAASGLAATVARTLGPIAILVNNAGEMTDAPIEAMTDAMWERVLAVNLGAAFVLMRACIPAMKARNWGRIINITSQAAYTGSANHANYAASKAGLLGLTFSAAKELGPFGITANAVAPGRITTAMVLDRAEGREAEWLSQTPMGRFGRPEEVADAIVFLASERASYITGSVLKVTGGQNMG